MLIFSHMICHFKIQFDRVRSCVRIPRINSFFLFSNSKIFLLILISRLPTVARPFKVLIRVIIIEFYISLRKTFTKMFTYRREGLQRDSSVTPALPGGLCEDQRP